MLGSSRGGIEEVVLGYYLGLALDRNDVAPSQRRKDIEATVAVPVKVGDGGQTVGDETGRVPR